MFRDLIRHANRYSVEGSACGFSIYVTRVRLSQGSPPDAVDLLCLTRKPLECPGEKRHININFLLWLTSKWPWGKRLVVPGLTGPKRFMCSPRNTGNINFSLWLTGGLSQGCPDFHKVYVFKVYVPLSQHHPKGNNYNSNGHLMQHLYSANVVALLSGELEMVL